MASLLNIAAKGYDVLCLGIADDESVLVHRGHVWHGAHVWDPKSHVQSISAAAGSPQTVASSCSNYCSKSTEWGQSSINITYPIPLILQSTSRNKHPTTQTTREQLPRLSQVPHLATRDRHHHYHDQSAQLQETRRRWQPVKVDRSFPLLTREYSPHNFELNNVGFNGSINLTDFLFVLLPFVTSYTKYQWVNTHQPGGPALGRPTHGTKHYRRPPLSDEIMNRLSDAPKPTDSKDRTRVQPAEERREFRVRPRVASGRFYIVLGPTRSFDCYVLPPSNSFDPTSTLGTISCIYTATPGT
uniref:Uncharacterized protein n=1 Tax=Timema monikensis TaxID=170555 RepID=A0A7R9HL56_9NEOP|nr:unnamed protein product [Timema monikensis]